MNRLNSKSGFLSGGVFIVILVLASIAATLFVLGQKTSFFNFASTSGFRGEIKIKVDATNVIGRVDPYPLGVNDVLTRVVSGIYPNPKQTYWQSTVGQDSLKKLGITTLRLDGQYDWQKPADRYSGIPPATWVQPNDPSTSCDPFTSSDCVPSSESNVGSWCINYIEKPLNRYLKEAASFGGPIVYIASVYKDYHLKDSVYTDCSPKTSTSGPMLEVRDKASKKLLDTFAPEASFNTLVLKLRDKGYLDITEATPESLVTFLKEARRLGYPIKYVEMGNEPWNQWTILGEYTSDGLLRNPAPYIDKAQKVYQAVKQYDSSIQLGIPVHNVAIWNTELITKVPFDFVAIHHYTRFTPDSSEISEEQAVDLSYYDVGIRDIANDQITEYPQHYRELILKLNPAKVNVPMLLTEFQTLVLTPNKNGQTLGRRDTLFAGFAEASFYLDNLWPTTVNGKSYQGVKQAFLGQWGYEYILPATPKDEPVIFPSVHFLKTLLKIRGTNIVQTQVENGPANSKLSSRPAIESKAVMSKDGRTAQIVIFNHDPQKDYPITIEFNRFKPNTSATLTTIGHGGDIDFNTANTSSDPKGILPVTNNIALQILGTNIRNFVVPAHTFVLLSVTGETIPLPTPLLKITFNGSFSGNTYIPQSFELVKGKLYRTDDTEIVGGGLINLKSKNGGLTFLPSESLNNSANLINKNLVLEAVIHAPTGKDMSFKTLLGAFGSIYYRYKNNSSDSMEFGIIGQNPPYYIKNLEVPVVTNYPAHIALVYSYVDDKSSSLTLFINGCKISKTIVNSNTAAGKAADGVGFGKDVHPKATNRGWQGRLDAIAAATFTGEFQTSGGFQILPTAIQQCK